MVLDQRGLNMKKTAISFIALTTMCIGLPISAMALEEEESYMNWSYASGIEKDRPVAESSYTQSNYQVISNPGNVYQPYGQQQAYTQQGYAPYGTMPAGYNASYSANTYATTQTRNGQSAMVGDYFGEYFPQNGGAVTQRYAAAPMPMQQPMMGGMGNGCGNGVVMGGCQNVNVNTTMRYQYPVTKQYPISVHYPISIQRDVTVQRPVVMQQPIVVQRPVVVQQPVTVQQPPVVMQQQPVFMQQQPTYVQQQPVTVQAPATTTAPCCSNINNQMGGY